MFVRSDFSVSLLFASTEGVYPESGALKAISLANISLASVNNLPETNTLAYFALPIVAKKKIVE